MNRPQAAPRPSAIGTSKIGALRDVLLALLQEHERDGALEREARQRVRLERLLP